MYLKALLDYCLIKWWTGLDKQLFGCFEGRAHSIWKDFVFKNLPYAKLCTFVSLHHRKATKKEPAAIAALYVTIIVIFFFFLSLFFKCQQRVEIVQCLEYKAIAARRNLVICNVYQRPICKETSKSSKKKRKKLLVKSENVLHNTMVKNYKGILGKFVKKYSSFVIFSQIYYMLRWIF